MVSYERESERETLGSAEYEMLKSSRIGVIWCGSVTRREEKRDFFFLLLDVFQCDSESICRNIFF